MINGVGRYVGGPEMSWARLNVTQGQRYRFRIVNTSGIANYRFAIQNHTLTVCKKQLCTRSLTQFIGYRNRWSEPRGDYWRLR